MNSSLRLLCRPRGSLAWVGILVGCGSLLAQGNSANTPASAAKNAESASALAARFALPAETTPLPLLGAPVSGQSSAVNAAHNLAEVRPDQVLTSKQLSSDAKALVKDGKPDDAARKLAAINVAPTDTFAWHLETTQRLVQLAGQMSREGSGREAKTVVTESLRQLDQAALLAKTGKDAAGEARAYQAAGAIHDRFRGDPVAAIASYQAAVRADPANAGAKEALERLQKSYANLLSRGQKAKK